MSDKTGIQWTNSTWNPVVGCSIVSPACTNCYAMAQAARIQRMTISTHYAGTTKNVNGKPVWSGVLNQAPEHILTAPLRWKKPRRIFINSMSDLFHENMPDEWIDRVFAVMALAPQHTFQILTKRPKRMREYCSDPATPRRIAEIVCDLAIEHEIDVILIAPGVDQTMAPPGRRVYLEEWPLRNVWLGVTAEDQHRADERIPDLLATPSWVRFVSVEPMLGPINLTDMCNGHYFYDALRGERWHDAHEHANMRMPGYGRLGWVICGGESGPGARDNNFEANARALMAQCEAAGVAFFGKQNVGKRPLPADLMVREFPEKR